MEDMVTKFSSRFIITYDEQKVVFVDKHEALTLKSDEVHLVGLVLTQKVVNNEYFKQ